MVNSSSSLECKSKAQLLASCKKRGLAGNSSKTKAELMRVLRNGIRPARRSARKSRP